MGVRPSRIIEGGPLNCKQKDGSAVQLTGTISPLVFGTSTFWAHFGQVTRPILCLSVFNLAWQCLEEK